MRTGGVLNLYHFGNSRVLYLSILLDERIKDLPPLRAANKPRVFPRRISYSNIVGECEREAGDSALIYRQMSRTRWQFVQHHPSTLAKQDWKHWHPLHEMLQKAKRCRHPVDSTTDDRYLARHMFSNISNISNHNTLTTMVLLHFSVKPETFNNHPEKHHLLCLIA